MRFVKLYVSGWVSLKQPCTDSKHSSLLEDLVYNHLMTWSPTSRIFAQFSAQMLFGEQEIL